MAIGFIESENEISRLADDAKLTLNATIYEVGGTAPTSIIRADQDWYVDVEWEFTGLLARHFCGDWRLSVVLESVGPGEEYQLPRVPASIPMDPCGDGKYKYRINVRAGDVKANDDDGTLYLVGLTLGSRDSCKQASHIFAHATGPHLHFVPGPPHTNGTP